jgi:acyl carrier protein
LAKDTEKTIVQSIRTLLRRREQADVDVDVNADLYDDLHLDSLEVAELSATLEDDLGRDPYSEGLTPRTVAEVVEFYDT